jgi:N-acetyl-anhydromuramyl-L-alanine amidase AmpD
MEEEHTDNVGRRDFLAWAAAATALIALPGCVTQPEVASTAPRRRYRPTYDVAYASANSNLGPGTADFITLPDAPPAIIHGAPMQDATTYATAATPYTPPPMPQAAPQAQVIQASYTVPAEPTYAPPQQAPSLKLSAHRRILPAAAPAKVQAISRRTWAAIPANPEKMKPMGVVKRITIHHEGSAKPNNDATLIQVAATLRLIHSQHRKRMGAGDIGYHFIIDRTGTIWQGRDWAFQGAHTSGANPNNLGVMLLGNFEIQQPTGPQLSAMYSLVGSLVRKYGLNAATDIFGHSDFSNTQCPGRHLRPQINVLRASIR